MRRTLAIVLALAATSPRVWAKGDKAEDEEEDSEAEASDDDDSSADDEEGESKGEAPKDTGKEMAKEEDEEEALPDDGLRPKQNLTGHDLGTTKRASEFERDRFFVDKVDSEKTEKGTLVQGSIASSSFAYLEHGGNYAGGTTGGNAGPGRYFTELRLQTDFRHIAASRWDARIDTRGRLVATPDNNIGAAAGTGASEVNHIQSGFNGTNELEVRELWITRVGKRSDIFLGRQFVPDLGAIKFDGLRIDYAKSAKLTIIGFGGLYPVRGSRSITTDYIELKTPNGLNDAGKYVGTGGLGGAYRTVSSYGALGLVTMIPLQKEQARISITSNGYLRSGSKLDVYHFGLIDLIGASGFALTNLSVGANLKPNQRLRLTANVNHVDTETLGVQAGAFLNPVDTTPGGTSVVQNEAFIQRLATTAARAGISAGLGHFQRFEISTAVTYRTRAAVNLFTAATMMPTAIPLAAATSVEVWGSIVDRHSIKDTRIGIDGARSYGIGDQSYQRSNTLTVRGFALRQLPSGRGEWEGEVSYAKVDNDKLSSTPCDPLMAPTVETCFGASKNTLFSVGGQLVYRLKPNVLAIGNMYILRTTNVRNDMVTDPPIYGVTGFFRIAKRF